jgi:hypothetical protein
MATIIIVKIIGMTLNIAFIPGMTAALITVLTEYFDFQQS